MYYFVRRSITVCQSCLLLLFRHYFSSPYLVFLQLQTSSKRKQNYISYRKKWLSKTHFSQKTFSGYWTFELYEFLVSKVISFNILFFNWPLQKCWWISKLKNIGKSVSAITDCLQLWVVIVLVINKIIKLWTLWFLRCTQSDYKARTLFIGH